MPKPYLRDKIDVPRFRKEWERGTNYKVMADEFGLNPKQVIELRAQLGLESRYRKAEETHRFQVCLPQSMRKAIARRARQEGMSVSKYLQRLIRRDLGEAN